MNSLDELLHPISPAQFHADFQGRQPLHIPAMAQGLKREVLTWAGFNSLLNQSAIWTTHNLRLIRDYVAVPTEQYCRPVQTPVGSVMRPWPPKVEVFLSAGASLIANDLLYAHPPFTEIGQTLGRTFAASIGANVYCSFQGVQAFGTHFDHHDVMVIQTEGEKVWNLYENRASNPIDPPADDETTRRWFAQSRGTLMSAIRMKPGDVLYLPRGWYHDALATDGASLHVTFAITPLHGRNLATLLDLHALEDPAYRAFLPPATEGGGDGLRECLAEMARLLSEKINSAAFFEEVCLAQERIIPRAPVFDLPRRKPATLFRTTGRAFPTASKAVRATYDWAIVERQFALEDMVAQFESLTEADIRAGVAAAETAGALQRV
jgi:hypothetical protein